MSEEFSKIESLLDKAKEYINTRVAQAKLSVAEKVSNILSIMIAGFVTILVFLIFLLFGSIAAAIAIGNWLCMPWAGFLIIGAVWLLLGIIIWNGRNRLLRIPIMNAMLNSLFSENNEEDEKVKT